MWEDLFPHTLFQHGAVSFSIFVNLIKFFKLTFICISTGSGDCSFWFCFAISWVWIANANTCFKLFQIRKSRDLRVRGWLIGLCFSRDNASIPWCMEGLLSGQIYCSSKNDFEIESHCSMNSWLHMKLNFFCLFMIRCCVNCLLFIFCWIICRFPPLTCGFSILCKNALH